MGKISGKQGLFSKIHMAAFARGFPFLCKQTPCFSDVPVNSKLGRGIPSSVGFRLDREVWNCCFIVRILLQGWRTSALLHPMLRSWWKPLPSSPDSPSSLTGAHRRLQQALKPLLSTEPISIGLLGFNLFYLVCIPTNQPSCTGAQKIELLVTTKGFTIFSPLFFVCLAQMEGLEWRTDWSKCPALRNEVKKLRSEENY